MKRVVRVASVLTLAFALSGCTAGATATTPNTTATPQPSGVVVAAEGGSDVGNDRPYVTYDGLMVRRRVVIAILPTPGADLIMLRKALDKAATGQHTTLSDISASVLDPALLERLAPELAVVLPAGGTIPDARKLIAPASSESRTFPEVQEFNVASVLVHDLQFRVLAAHPAVLAAAIAREGILSDALGNYTTTLGRGELAISYTGPLLSDDLVELVRAGIARRAGTQPASVTVSPRSTTGVGVDMAKEPAQAPAATEISTAHNHGAALPAVLPAVGGSSPSSLWAVSVVALAALLILTLVMLMMRRFNQGPDDASGSSLRTTGSG
jgi:hypothetical protein